MSDSDFRHSSGPTAWAYHGAQAAWNLPVESYRLWSRKRDWRSLARHERGSNVSVSFIKVSENAGKVMTLGADVSAFRKKVIALGADVSAFEKKVITLDGNVSGFGTRFMKIKRNSMIPRVQE